VELDGERRSPPEQGYRLKPVTPIPATRRRFLEASAGAAVTTWLASVGATSSRGSTSSEGEGFLETVPFVGEGSFPLETTFGAGLGRRRALDLSTLTPAALLTPQDRFFVRTGCPDRLPSTTSWTVRVHGLVGAPREVPIGELKWEAVPAGAHLLECAGNSRAAHFGLMSAARWTGVPLSRLLERARVLPRATQVLVSGFDEHATLDPGSVPGASWIFGLDQARESGAFLATEMNGAPLSLDHGYPLRLVVPGWYGCTAIKWVNEIALVDDEALATDHMREYAGRTHQDPAGPRDRSLVEPGRRPEGPRLAKDFRPATVDPAALPVRIEKLGDRGGRFSHRIVGILWGGRTPPRALSIRLNPDLGFAPVTEIGRGSSGPWMLWSHDFRPPAPGRYRIELAVRDPAVRTRRLDMGFYAREVEIAGA
jgi:DMSO/TMAO reductase YedYZ molybdopterin-dependent catalytic subunit